MKKFLIIHLIIEVIHLIAKGVYFIEKFNIILFHYFLFIDLFDFIPHELLIYLIFNPYKLLIYLIMPLGISRF